MRPSLRRQGSLRTGAPAPAPLQTMTKLRMQKSLNISVEAFEWWSVKSENLNVRRTPDPLVRYISKNEMRDQAALVTS